MKKTPQHINVINAGDPARMGFYVPGEGIITYTKLHKKNSKVVNYSSKAPVNKQTFKDSSDDTVFISEEVMKYHMKRLKQQK